MAKRYRPDHDGAFRGEFELNRKKILASENVCAICGKPVDKSLRPPNPMAPTVDHIIPVSKGGHPSALSNLQLAHWTCNRQKSDKLLRQPSKHKEEVLGNRVLPQTMDWTKYRA
jgi:5-methylcytosine-specific restriction endonuclease McrA